jgi:hypothetical protein
LVATLCALGLGACRKAAVPQTGTEAVATPRAVAKARPVEPSEGLEPGNRFPDFNDYDVELKPVSPAAFRGNLVLIEYWALSSAPSMRDLAITRAIYEKYHSRGLEIIGINLDSDKEVLRRYLLFRPIPWAQYCDGMAEDSKLVTRYQVTRIPETFLLDRNGVILARGFHGDALDCAIGQALGDQP